MVQSEFQTRRELAEIGRRIWQKGYVAANDGNLSARIAADRVLITPTGRSKGFLRPEDMVVVDAQGRKVSGEREPTSELPMHLFVYAARADIGAVVHAHPPRATGFAVAGVPLAQCVLPEVILTLGRIPLTDYATPSTEEVPASIEAFIERYNAILLRNHGVLTFGATLEEAYYRMETVEHFAEITLAAKMLGGAAPLSRDDVRKLLEVKEKLGITGFDAGCYDCGACDYGDTEGSAAAAAPRLAAEGQSRADEAPQQVSEPGSCDEEEIVQAVVAKVRKALSQVGPEASARGEANDDT